jgi:PAS domain S-box-containing protein
MAETGKAEGYQQAGLEPSDPLPAPAIVSHWLEGARAVLEPSGEIVEIDASFGLWLAVPGQELIGRPFWNMLVERCPLWAGAVAKIREDKQVLGRVDLSLPGERDAMPLWYRLETTRLPGGWLVRLSSMLPPTPAWTDTRGAATWGGEPARADLFVRLLRAETQLQRLGQYWPGVTFRQRPDFSFESVTGRLEELTGWTLDECYRQPGQFWSLVHDGDAEELRRKITLSVKERQPVSSEFRIRHRVSGRVSYILEHRQPVFSQTGLLLGYEGVWLDMTRQTLAEKLLTSAAWKETLAVLMMGLAHDFSNVMAGIHSLSESFLNQLEAGHPFREGMGLIKKSSLQASQLVHRIVNLHLGKPGERNYHDLNQIVGDLLELMRKVVPRRIEIVTELCAGTLPLYVDAFEFRQVIINLALNASDAMPERGRLLIRTERMHELPVEAAVQGNPPRFPGACITVRDNGCGIKPAHLQLIFDPFFTTKSGGKGSGLGLYNARLFAEKHQGVIWVDSIEGHGASFHVYLPEADFSETPVAVPAAPEVSTRRSLMLYGPACALFDETAEVLRTEGYHVATAHTLERLDEFLSAGDYPYHGVLVLTETTGSVLAPHVAAWRRQHPGLRIILRPMGRNSDELEAGLLQLADLVITPELSHRALLDNLRATLTL